MINEEPWYAVYTKSRHEKRLAELLNEKGIEAYVPLRKVVRQWSDRKKLVSEPLIRSYCFVRPGPGEYYDVLNTDGAVRYVWFSGKPAPIPNKQIDILKVLTGSDVDVDVVPGSLLKGTTVRVNAGPLAGVALGLPVYHIMEPEIKAQIDPAVYKEHLELMEIALDVAKISEGLNRVRKAKS